MPAENSGKLLPQDVGDSSSSSLNTTLVSNNQVDIVSAALSADGTSSNLSEGDTAISKLTAQDLEDLEKIQAELDSLTSNFPDNSLPDNSLPIATTSVPTGSFTNTNVSFSNNTPVPVSSASLEPMLAPKQKTTTVIFPQQAQLGGKINAATTSIMLKPVTIGQTILSNAPSINTLITSASTQPISVPISTFKGGKQVLIVQKPVSISTSSNSVLNQSRMVTVSPSKTITGTPVLSTSVMAGKRSMILPVSLSQGPSTSGSAPITVSASSLKGDIKVIMPHNFKGAQISGSAGGITFANSNVSFIQTVSGKQITNSSGQILSKVKFVNAPAGTQFATATSVAGAVGGTFSFVDQATGQKTTQQPTILLASPNKTFTLARGNTTQLLRAVPGTQSKPGVLLLSPVKGKLGTFSNLSLKSPTRIAPAPNAINNTAKVTIVSAASVSGLTTTTTLTTVARTSATSSSPQKLILRPIVPVNTKSIMGSVSNSNTIIASTSSSSNLKQTIPVSTVLTGAGMQQIQVPGTKFNYVRLVSAPINQGTSNIKQGTLIPVSSARSITSGTTSVVCSVAKPDITTLVAGSTKQVRLSMPGAQTVTVAANQTSAKAGNQQRVLIPSNAKIESGTTGATSTFTHFPPGSILSTGSGPGMPSFVMVSAQYVAQLQQGQTNGAPRMVLQAAPNVLGTSPNFVPIAAASAPRQFDQQASQPMNSTINPQALSRQSNGAPIETTESRPRKPCNCTKSQCLKLYCDCFANGEFCHNCNCTNCYNNLEHEEDRQKAIKSCLDRNPQAFHPKIGKTRRGRDGDHERRHTKGCNCKRSGCLKNYCECYEAKILCTNLCKCNGCKNFEDSNERKTLMHLADAAEVRVQQQATAKTKISSQIQDMPIRPPIVSLTGERLPFSFVTQEVTEATLDCMLARAEDGERSDTSVASVERQILEEFGRCLLQIIDCANRTRAK